MLRVLIINFVVLIPFILGQQPGSCPNIKGEPLDAHKAAGIWYLNSRSGNGSDPTLKCGRAIWSAPNGSNFTILFKSISTITNKVSSVVVEGSTKSATFRHHVPVLGEVDIDAILLGVDYDRWAIRYQCDSNEDTKIENFWVFTRQQFPDVRRLSRFIDQSFNKWGLQKPEFTKNPQNCQF